MALRVTLPLGISFYTFQSMSYAIDVYRGDAAPIRSFIDFACFVSMFPQLVAGPIIRFSEIADQLRSPHAHDARSSRAASRSSRSGLAKKVLLANPCGKIADLAFDAGSLAPLDAWYGVTAYAFQIYFDFSGYSDMAIGLGLMLGFVFAEELRLAVPARSRSPSSGAAGTSRSRPGCATTSTSRSAATARAAPRTYVNLFLVMLLGGLWHGAAWNFVIWGGLHGVLLAFERLRGKAPAYGRLRRAACASA